MEMNNFKKEIKIALWAFGIGFIFSFVIGLIVGNPIFISLIRAFVASLLFSMVIFGIVYVIKKYVPELTEVSIRSKESIEESRTGENESIDKGTRVDYLVGEKSNSGKEKSSTKGSASEKVSEVESSNFDSILSNIEKKEELKSDEGIAEKESVSIEDAEEGENEDELPPIEELLNEEEDTVPEAEIEEETISSSEKKIDSDYIKIGDVKIPNEPEIIAKAIKKVMKENE